MKWCVLKNSRTAVYLQVNIWIASGKCYKTNPEVVVLRCSVEKMFLDITQNSQENTCGRVSFLIKLQAQACNFIQNQTLGQVFSCEFVKFLRATFFIEHLQWLLLSIQTIPVLLEFYPLVVLSHIYIDQNSRISSLSEREER